MPSGHLLGGHKGKYGSQLALGTPRRDLNSNKCQKMEDQRKRTSACWVIPVRNDNSLLALAAFKPVSALKHIEDCSSGITPLF